MKWVLAAAAVGIATAAMGSGADPAPADGAGTYPEDWVELDVASVFRIHVPPKSVISPRPGKDSRVGKIMTASFELEFDYGLYAAAPRKQEGDTEYRAEPVVVDGRRASLVQWSRAGADGAGLKICMIHFPELEKTSLGWLKLTVRGSFASAETARLAIKALMNIRFAGTEAR